MWSVVAVVISFVAFWSVAYRNWTMLRMLIFCGLMILHLKLTTIPIDDGVVATDDTFRYWIRFRLIVGLTAGFVAGTYARVMGWRLQKLDSGNSEQTEAATSQVWLMILGIAGSVPVLFVARALARIPCYTLFDDDFALLTYGCLLAAWVLAFVSITLCRFSNQWLVAAAVIITGLSLQLLLRDRLYDSLGVRQLSGIDAYRWFVFTHCFVLAWWMISWLLSRTGVGFLRTKEWLLLQLQIKHFAVASCVAALLVANVKSKFTKQYAETIASEVKAFGGVATIRGNQIVGLRIVSNGLADSLTEGNPPLNSLKTVTLNRCMLDQELLAIVQNRPNLTNLRIEFCQTSPMGPVSISGFDQVENLALVDDSTLSPPTIDFLLRLSNLKRLSLTRDDLISQISSPSLQHLDLSNCRFSKSYGYDSLLKMEAPELTTIQLADADIGPFQGFTNVPVRFPNLTEFSLVCPKLTRSIVGELNRFPLEHLRLQEMESGYEYVAELNVPQLQIDGTFEDAESIRDLLKDDRVTHITGSAVGPVIVTCIEDACTAYTQRGLTCLLGTHPTKRADSEEISELKATYSKMGRIGLEKRLLRQDEWRATRPNPILKIENSGKIHLSQIRLSLKQFIAVLKTGSDFKILNPTSEGNRVIVLPSTYAYGAVDLPSVYLNEIEDSEWLKIAEVLNPKTPVSFIEPNLTSEGWRQIAKWPGEVSIIWDTLPDNVEPLLDSLGEKQVGVRIPFVGLRTKQKSTLWKYENVKCTAKRASDVFALRLLERIRR